MNEHQLKPDNLSIDINNSYYLSPYVYKLYEKVSYQPNKSAANIYKQQSTLKQNPSNSISKIYNQIIEVNSSPIGVQQKQNSFNTFEQLINQDSILNKTNSFDFKLMAFSQSGWIWQNKIFLIGGNILKSKNNKFQQPLNNSQNHELINTPEDESMISVICYDLIFQKWRFVKFTKKNINQCVSSASNSKKIEKTYNFLSHYTQIATCQDDNIVYLLGGSHIQTFETTNILCKLDMQKMSLERIETKGEIPQPRQGSKLFKYDDSWLILYGGSNFLEGIFYNDFYAYHINQQTWHNMNGSFQYLVNARIHFGMTIDPSTKNIYLFGGVLMNYQYQNHYLNDLYQFKAFDLDLASKRQRDNKRQKGKIQVRPILSKKYPPPRAAHQLIYLKYNFLLAIGGQTIFILQKIVLNDIWIFNIKNRQWAQIVSEQNKYLHARRNFSLCSTEAHPDSLFIFGGQPDIGLNFLNVNSQSTSLNNVSQVHIDTETYQNSENSQKNAHKCFLCQLQNKNQDQLDMIPVFECQFIDKFIFSGMSFAFSAFGLLINNVIDKQAQKVYIQYSLGQRNSIIIQDDSILQFKAQQIEPYIHQFNISNTYQLQTNDKRSKSIIVNKFKILKFCNNLKIASLRLGSCFLWIARSQSEILIYCINKQQKQQQQVYASYFYALQINNFQLVKGFQVQIKKKVQKLHIEALPSNIKINQIQTGYNILKIDNLRKKFSKSQSLEKQKNKCLQLLGNVQKNTILINEQNVERKFYYSRQLREEQSIDLNLKAYISMLYINRSTRIFLRIVKNDQISNDQIIQNKNHKYLNHNRSDQLNNKSTNTQNKFQQINAQQTLPKIDQLILKNKLIQVNNDVFQQFDIKSMEIYYDPMMCQKEQSNTLSSQSKLNLQYNKQNLQQKKARIIQRQQNQKKSKFEQDLYPNGLLFYHKNRLISRYKYPLGSVYTFYQNKHSLNNSKQNNLNKQAQQKQIFKRLQPECQTQKYINLDLNLKLHMRNRMRMFGIIAIPDKIPVNVFQTGFLYPEMLERLYQKIQYVSSMFEKAYNFKQEMLISNKPQPKKISHKKVAIEDKKFISSMTLRQQKQNHNIVKSEIQRKIGLQYKSQLVQEIVQAQQHIEVKQINRIFNQESIENEKIVIKYELKQEIRQQKQQNIKLSINISVQPIITNQIKLQVQQRDKKQNNFDHNEIINEGKIQSRSQRDNQ